MNQKSGSHGHQNTQEKKFRTVAPNIFGVLSIEIAYVAQTKSGLQSSALLVCATYGSIQSVRKPDTAYIQCPPEDERCDARNM
jgi:hypothetical protein